MKQLPGPVGWWSLCVLLSLVPPLFAQAEDGPGDAPQAQDAAAPAPATAATEQAAAGTENPPDPRGEDYDWDQAQPWDQIPRDRTRPTPTQEELRRPNLSRDRDASGRVALRYARELAAQGALNQALIRYRDFLVLFPRHEWRLEAMLGAAEILQKLDRVEEAIGYLEQGYRESPHREQGALGYLRAGRLYAEMGRFEEARRVFTRLTARKPASRVARLAALELNSLGFLDSQTTGEKTGGAEVGTDGEASQPGENPADARPAPASGDIPAGSTPAAPGGPAQEQDGLDRMGEGVEKL